METLKLVLKQQTETIANELAIQTDDYTKISESELIKLFPLPRYFQIHFQHIHDNADNLKTELTELKQTVQQMNEKINLLVQLLMQTHI
jgi:hypothetical protein